MWNRRCAMLSMRAESLRARRWLLQLVLAVMLTVGPVHAQPAASSPAASAPLDRDTADAAAHALHQDPALNRQEVSRQLRFKDWDRPPEPDTSATPIWIIWLAGLGRWLGEAGRFLVWALGALAVALLVVRLWPLWRDRQQHTLDQAVLLPTHVRNFDIRPQSLPDDIGAAALALWQAGQALAAMSLLYRGALSQLVHRHGVPIRSSSTEGDCLQLAAPRLDAAARHYVETLVGAWRGAVYAGRLPSTDTVNALCDDFAAQLAMPEAAA